jgi:hypothetical protein
MMLLLFLLTFNSILDSLETKYIGEALKALNLREADLEYEKKWTDQDSFRLSIVNELMDNPLSVPNYLEESIDNLKNRELEDIFKFMSGEIDIPIEKDIKRVEREIGDRFKFYEKDSINFEPKLLWKILSVLYASLEVSEKYWKEAIKNLSKGEIDTLIYESVHLWSDEDDSTDDTLRGVLFREFEIPYDTSWEIKEKDILSIASKISREEFALSFYSLIYGLSKVLPLLDSLEKPTEDLVLDTRWGKIIIGGIEQNYYNDSFPIIIDLGGDDVYEGRIAGGIGGIEGSYPISLVIDLGGNDKYFSKKSISMGAGFLGNGILIDTKGNDTYLGNHISLGAGLFGYGLLMDMDGDDFFYGGYFTEGSGNFGMGILIDGSGNDAYRAIDWAQGFGSVQGYGFINDRSGNDIYYAGGYYIHHPLLPDQFRSFAQGFGMGWRPESSGGIGFLLDEGGNDLYYVEVYGQGCSYWYSLGMLADLGGNDTYNAAEYAQGAGIHLSVGILFDLEGKDHYYSRFGPSQGEGHDLSIGFLIDKSGDDTYQVSGGQGIGLTNSIGIFIDSKGNDTYLTTETLGQGNANWARGFGGIGIFIDLSGKDSYPTSSKARNNRYWTQGTFGCGIDVEEMK